MSSLPQGVGPAVHPYSKAEFIRLLSASSISTDAAISSKRQTDYLDQYLQYLDVKTIVVEPDYIDHDYLEDYVAYYVRCFQQYRKRCTRLHFFSQEFSKEQLHDFFKGTISGISELFLAQAYLGFIVVKPLPLTIIGRTCLKTYDPDGGRRSYPVTRSYTANLYGVQLPIMSLAFQEQDSVAAACATSALWSVFQGTGRLFQHGIPSPVEITNSATEHWVPSTRVLPNDGLTEEQMAYAIRKAGLEPFLLRATDAFLLKAAAYAYIASGIPLLLGMAVINPKGVLIGKHAVALSGFSLGHVKALPYGPTGILFKSSRMDKLYVHDDQMGPFARVGIDDDHLTLPYNDVGNPGTWIAVPTNLIIPLYHKIRIPFNSIFSRVCGLDTVLNAAVSLTRKPGSCRLEWDVRLTTVNTFKQGIIANSSILASDRLQVLWKSYPRFLWQATAQADGKPLLDLLFDATEIEQGDLLLSAITYDPAVKELLTDLAQSARKLPDYAWLLADPVWDILEEF